ncbi:hypothetical protein OJAV_G00169550 [Oryzias javanicus]|uniref:THAP domain-containing protein 1 n=1 Tax=Oryzias javanicus TaxID=123683 RepID=A0A437CEI4_ORYJA|nr:hypothetical protein OJAV_G00169550 [Oryzias javanicus]
MARRCIVLGCPKSNGLHNFPVDLEIRQKWFSAIGIESSELRPGDGICNEHFTRDCFANFIEVEMGFLKRLRLKSHAVPTLALRRLSQQYRRLEPKVPQEIGCPTALVTCICKSEESRRACSTSLKRKRWEWSTNGSSNQMDGGPSTGNCTSTCEVSPNTGKKYIVNEDQLLKLFQRCPVCSQTCTIQKSTDGTILRVNQRCPRCDYHNEWSSQPLVNDIPVENNELSAAILVNGSSSSQISKERNSSPDQAEPEPPQIKEELCSNQEGKELLLNLQTDVKEKIKSECEETLKVCGNIMSNFKAELDQDCSLQNTIRIPETQLQRKGQTELHLLSQKNSSLDQAEPEPPLIKEEPKELCINQEGEQLVLNQETKVEMEIKSDLLDQEHHLGIIIKVPVVKLKRIDLSEQQIFEESEAEQLLWKQERSSSLEEEEPEFSEIKEEQEEVYIGEEGEQLELKQETDAFMVTEDDQERMDSEPESNESQFLEENTDQKL